MSRTQSTACSRSDASAFTNGLQRVNATPGSLTRPKTLRLGEWHRVCVQMQQVITDTDLADHIGVSRPLVNAWRDPRKPTLPTAEQIARMPLEAALPWIHEMLRILSEQNDVKLRVVAADEQRVSDVAPQLRELAEKLAALAEGMKPR